MIENLRPIFPNQAIPAIFGESVSYTQQVAYLAYKLQECIEWINEQKSVEIPVPTLEDVTKVLNVINQNGEAKLGWNGELPANVSSLLTRTSSLEGRTTALENGKQIEVIEKSGNLDVDAWSNNLQTITVNGVEATDVVIVGPTYGADSSAGSYELYGIKPYAQTTDTLTFQCANPPTENIALNIILLKHNS